MLCCCACSLSQRPHQKPSFHEVMHSPPSSCRVVMELLRLQALIRPSCGQRQGQRVISWTEMIGSNRPFSGQMHQVDYFSVMPAAGAPAAAAAAAASAGVHLGGIFPSVTYACTSSATPSKSGKVPRASLECATRPLPSAPVTVTSKLEARP